MASLSSQRNRGKTQVFLNVYDLSPANTYLYPIGFGLHHSGVEVLGSEYTFADQAGVFDQGTPRQVPNAKYRESIDLGIFHGGSAELKQALSEVKQDFGPDDYDLVRKNCNHFANALVWKLLGRQIPPHVNRLSDVGVCCSCLLPKNRITGGNPGDETATENSSSGFQSFGPRSTTMTTPAFTGSGARLGSSSQQSTSRFRRSASPRTTTGTDDLMDRRERARMAAMARMERKGAQQD